MRYIFAIFLLLIAAWADAGQGMYPIPIPYQAGSAPSNETLTIFNAVQADWSSSLGAYPSHNTAISDSTDTTYIYKSTNNAFEVHNLTDTVESGTIASLTLYIRAQAVNAGDTIMMFLNDGTYRYATNSTLTTSWAEYSYAWAVNPATSSAWLKAEVDAIRCGVRSTALTAEARVSEVWAVVAYE